MALTAATFVLMIAVVGIHADHGPCPPRNDIYPCYCESDRIMTSITCEKLNDLSRLKSVMEAAKGLNITFGVYNSRLGDIPSDFFEGQKTEDIVFDSCSIGSFGNKPFSGLENTLKKLYIYMSVDKRIKDLETFPMSHLKNLRSLSFLGNDIKRVGREWFEGGPQTLQDLSLESNDIEVLEDFAFVSLINVEEFWLGNNRYKVIKRSMFPQPAPKLSLLEISFSEIEVLPRDLFTGMPKLKSVNVSGNKLVSLPQDTWGSVWNQLEEVYVDRNRLECNEEIKWIFQRKLPKILDGKCYGHNSLRGKKLEQLTLKDFE